VGSIVTDTVRAFDCTTALIVTGSLADTRLEAVVLNWKPLAPAGILTDGGTGRSDGAELLKVATRPLAGAWPERYAVQVAVCDGIRVPGEHASVVIL